MKIKQNLFFPIFMMSLFMIQISIFAQNISFIPNSFLYNLIDIAIALMAVESLLLMITLKLPLKKWLIIFLIITISFFCTIKTNTNFFIIFCLTIISSLTFDFKKIIKVDLLFKIALLLFIVICYKLGKVDNIYFVRAGELRNAFGFVNPNAFGFFVMMIFYELIYTHVYKDSNDYLSSRKIIVLIVLGGISIFIINFSASRSSELCILIFEMLMIMSYIKHKTEQKREKADTKNRKHKLVGILAIVLFTIISIYLGYHLDNYKIQELNEILSGRISIIQYYITNYKIKPIGQYIDFVRSLDNAYVNLIIHYGIAGYMLFTLIYNKMFNESKKDICLHCILITFLFYGLMEWFLIRPVINIFLIYYSTLAKKTFGIQED